MPHRSSINSRIRGGGLSTSVGMTRTWSPAARGSPGRPRTFAIMRSRTDSANEGFGGFLGAVSSLLAPAWAALPGFPVTSVPSRLLAAAFAGRASRTMLGSSESLESARTMASDWLLAPLSERVERYFVIQRVAEHLSGYLSESRHNEHSVISLRLLSGISCHSHWQQCSNRFARKLDPRTRLALEAIARVSLDRVVDGQGDGRVRDSKSCELLPDRLPRLQSRVGILGRFLSSA